MLDGATGEAVAEAAETGSGGGFWESLHIGGLLTGIIVLVGTWLMVRLIRGTMAQMGKRFTDRRLLFNQLATIAAFIVYLAGIALAIGASVTLSQEMMFALAGAGAMTVGFALKDLAASILAGLMIIIDRPFQVGDRVSFGGYYGEITAIGLRSVRLTTLDDSVVTIPNNKFLTDAVSSGNWGALDMLIQMDFFIGADQDLPLARRLLEECLTSSRYVFLRKPWTVLTHQMIEGNYFAIRLRAKAYVLDCQYEKAFETDVTERVIEAFREHGILPPAVLHRPAGESAPERAEGVGAGH